MLMFTCDLIEKSLLFNIIYFVQDKHLYVTKKITCQKSPIFRTFLRIWTLKFHSQNRGSPKAFFECFWDLNGRFFIFKRNESRFGEKFPNTALFYCEKLSQSFRRFLVRYAEPVESHYSRLVRHFLFPLYY